MSKISVARSKGRGVSPIIATILLVAITVVMAAVLYVLVSGYFMGSNAPPPNPPIAVGWSAVASTNQSGVNYWYNATVESYSPANLRWSDISTVTVKNSQGGAFQSSFAGLFVTAVNGGTAVYQPSAGWTYTAPVSSSTTIAGGDTITIELHSSDAGGSVVFAPSSSYAGASVLDIPT